MKIVCDTNVVVSGLLFPGGPPDRILRAVLTGRLQNVTSPDLLTELRRILRRVFALSEERIGELVDLLTESSDVAYPTERLEIVNADPTDNRVLECALAGRAAYLITGDAKHLLPLKTFRRIRIISPGQFVREIGIT